MENRGRNARDGMPSADGSRSGGNLPGDISKRLIVAKMLNLLLSIGYWFCVFPQKFVYSNGSFSFQTCKFQRILCVIMHILGVYYMLCFLDPVASDTMIKLLHRTYCAQVLSFFRVCTRLLVLKQFWLDAVKYWAPLQLLVADKRLWVGPPMLLHVTPYCLCYFVFKVIRNFQYGFSYTYLTMQYSVDEWYKQLIAEGGYMFGRSSLLATGWISGTNLDTVLAFGAGIAKFADSFLADLSDIMLFAGFEIITALLSGLSKYIKRREDNADVAPDHRHADAFIAFNKCLSAVNDAFGLHAMLFLATCSVYYPIFLIADYFPELLA